MTETPTRYLSCAETAKLLRAALKQAFPAVKFGVKSSVYSGGASIDVRWTDGPTAAKVERIAKQFEGADFDGMIDLKTYSEHWMTPDGCVHFAHNPGTYGNGGLQPEQIGLPPHPGAELVRFAADYVFCHRTHTAGLLQAVTRKWAEYWGKPLPLIHGSFVDAWPAFSNYDDERTFRLMLQEEEDRA